MRCSAASKAAGQLGGLGPRRPTVAIRRRRLVVSAGSGDRQPWDFGRFLKTVLFFNPLPAPDQVVRTVLEQPAKMVEALTGGAKEGAAASAIVPLIGGSRASGVGAKERIVLVTGATGGVGRRVVGLLLQKGRRVRALVRDVGKAKQLLGSLPAAGSATLDLVAADVAQRATLLPEMFVGVRQVVWCSAAKVVPKEGDTPGRQKYYQGIKFYDPRIEGDTPEAVEYRGMTHALGVLARSLAAEGAPAAVYLPDGSAPAKEWGPLDDVVMGGASSSGFEVRRGGGEGGGSAGVFSGRVTTANSGGFASVRTRNLSPPLELSAYDGLELRLRGDGQRYKLIVRTEASWDGIGYTASFDTQPGAWQTVRLPFSSFVPVFRARTVRDAPAMDPSSVYSIQLMLSKFEYDGALNPSFREGPFELPLQRVGAYVQDPGTPRFVMVSSAGVTRPNRPGIAVDEEPPAVKLNDELGGLLTYKLKAEDALRQAGVSAAVVRPVALTEEPAGAELVVDQGDTIRGKVSREDVAQLCVALLDQPGAAGLTFEVKSTVPFSQPFTVDPAAPPPPPRDWGALLRGAGLKKGVTGKTVGGRYTGREPEATVGEAADASV